MSQEGEKVLQFGSVLLLSTFNVSNTGGVDVNVGMLRNLPDIICF
jgi:hypothetical protein